MTNAALFDFTQTTLKEMAYIAAVLFYKKKKKCFSRLKSCNKMMSKFKKNAIILSSLKKFIKNYSFSGVRRVFSTYKKKVFAVEFG